MSSNCQCNVLRLRHFIFGIIACVPQPSDIKVVTFGCDLLSAVKAKTSFFTFVLALGHAVWIITKGLLKGPKIIDFKKPCLAEGIHIRAHVIYPQALRAGPIGIATRHKENIRLNALRIEDAGRQTQHSVDIAKLHHPITKPATHILLEQDVIGNDDGRTGSRLESSDDVLHESELFVRRFRRDGEIRARRPSPSLFCSEWRIRKNHIRLADALTVWCKSIPA